MVLGITSRDCFGNKMRQNNLCSVMIHGRGDGLHIDTA